jgi:hypothetical protein
MTYMVVVLRHKDQIIRVRTSPTCECDGQFTQEKNLCPKGFRFARSPLRHFTTSSLPLLSASPRGRWPGTGSRGQGCFYCEVARVLDWKGPPASSTRTGWHQPVGGRGFETILEPQSRPWLSAKPNTKSVVKINISMIVCRLKKCRRFITGWCPTNLRENHRPN